MPIPRQRRCHREAIVVIVPSHKYAQLPQSQPWAQLAFIWARSGWMFGEEIAQQRCIFPM